MAKVKTHRKGGVRHTKSGKTVMVKETMATVDKKAEKDGIVAALAKQIAGKKKKAKKDEDPKKKKKGKVKATGTPAKAATPGKKAVKTVGKAPSTPKVSAKAPAAVKAATKGKVKVAATKQGKAKPVEAPKKATHAKAAPKKKEIAHPVKASAKAKHPVKATAKTKAAKPSSKGSLETGTKQAKPKVKAPAIAPKETARKPAPKVTKKPAPPVKEIKKPKTAPLPKPAPEPKVDPAPAAKTKVKAPTAGARVNGMIRDGLAKQGYSNASNTKAGDVITREGNGLRYEVVKVNPGSVRVKIEGHNQTSTYPWTEKFKPAPAKQAPEAGAASARLRAQSAERAAERKHKPIPEGMAVQYLKNRHPNLTPAQRDSIIQMEAKPGPDGVGRFYTHAILDEAAKQKPIDDAEADATNQRKAAIAAKARATKEANASKPKETPAPAPHADSEGRVSTPTSGSPFPAKYEPQLQALAANAVTLAKQNGKTGREGVKAMVGTLREMLGRTPQDAQTKATANSILDEIVRRVEAGTDPKIEAAIAPLVTSQAKPAATPAAKPAPVGTGQSAASAPAPAPKPEPKPKAEKPAPAPKPEPAAKVKAKQTTPSSNDIGPGNIKGDWKKPVASIQIGRKPDGSRMDWSEESKLKTEAAQAVKDAAIKNGAATGMVTHVDHYSGVQRQVVSMCLAMPDGSVIGLSGEVHPSMAGLGAPKPGHKYLTRTYVDGHWVYTYTEKKAARGPYVRSEPLHPLAIQMGMPAYLATQVDALKQYDDAWRLHRTANVQIDAKSRAKYIKASFDKKQQKWIAEFSGSKAGSRHGVEAIHDLAVNSQSAPHSIDIDMDSFAAGHTAQEAYDYAMSKLAGRPAGSHDKLRADEIESIKPGNPEYYELHGKGLNYGGESHLYDLPESLVSRMPVSDHMLAAYRQAVADMKAAGVSRETYQQYTEGTLREYGFITGARGIAVAKFREVERRLRTQLMSAPRLGAAIRAYNRGEGVSEHYESLHKANAKANAAAVGKVKSELGNKRQAMLAAQSDFSMATPKKIKMPKGQDLRKVQRAAMSWMNTAKRGVLGLGTGVGKTLTSIAHATQLQEQGKIKTAMVVASTGVLKNWEDQIKQYRPDAKVVTIYGTPSERDALIAHAKKSGADFVLVPYSMVQDEGECGKLKNMGAGAVYYDEAKGMLNSQTSTYKNAEKHLMGIEYNFALTASPLRNNIDEVFDLVNLFHDGVLGSKVLFRQNYTRTDEIESYTDSSGKTKKRSKTTGFKNLKQLSENISPFVMIRDRGHQDVDIELPPLDSIRKISAMEPEHRQAYDRVRRAVAERLIKMMEEGASEGELSAAQRAQAMVEILRMRQAAVTPALVDPAYDGASKIDDVVDELEAHFTSGTGKGVVIFSDFGGPLGELVKAKLINRGIIKDESEFGAITGGVDRAEKARVQDGINDGSIKIAFVGIKAGGEGLNMQKNADTVMFLNTSWNEESTKQAVARVYRQGQKNKVRVLTYVADDSVDTYLEHVTENKGATFNAVIHGDADGADLVRLKYKDFLAMTGFSASELEALSKREYKR